MQADGGLVQHVQGVYQVRSERVRERDALCLAARECARLAVECEVSQTNVIHKAYARAQLAEDMVRDLLLKRRELKSIQPGREVARSQRRHFRDGFAGHAHRERFWLEPRAATSWARLSKLVLPQEHPDVLFVALFLEPLEERKDPEVAAFRVVEQEVTLARRNILPTHIQANAAGTSGLAQQAPTSFVAGLGPGIERPIGERAQRIRHDQRFVVLQHRTEAIAPRAGAARIIEGKER